MSQKEFNSNSRRDELLRSTMDNLPPEKPDAGEWEALKSRLQEEGILPSGRRRVTFYFSLSMFMLAITGAFFLMNMKAGQDVISSNAERNTIIEKQSIQTQTLTTEQNSSRSVSDKKVNNEEAITGQNLITSFTATQKQVLHQEKKSTVTPSRASSETQLKPMNTDEQTSIKKDFSSKNKSVPLRENISDSNVKELPDAVTVIQESPDTEQTKNDNSIAASNELISLTTPGSVIEKNVPDSSSIKNEPDDKKQNCYSPRRKDFSKLSLGVYLSVDKNHFGYNATNVTGGQMITAGIPVKDNFQYSAGLTLEYRIVKTLSAETGILFSQKRKFQYSYLNELQGDFDYEQFDYSFSGHYIEVPFQLKFYFYQSPGVNNKVLLYFSPGILATLNLPEKNNDFFIRRTNNSEGSATSQVLLESQSLGLAGLFSAGCKLKFNQCWSVYVEPNYQYHFNPVVKHPTYRDIPVEQFIRTMSVACGLKYDF